MTWQALMAIDRAFSAERSYRWALEDLQLLIDQLTEGYRDHASILASSVLSNLYWAAEWWSLAKSLDADAASTT